MSRLRLVMGALLLLLGARQAEAACTLSATAVAFGAYDVYQAGPTDSTGTVSYRCANNDRNIRIAPSFPSVADIRTAIEVLAICIQLAHLEKLEGK